MSDFPNGLNDGSANGKTYFKALPNHGVFVRHTEIAETGLPEESFLVSCPFPDPVSKGKSAWALLHPNGTPKYLIRDFVTVAKVYKFLLDDSDDPLNLEPVFSTRLGTIYLGDSSSQVVGSSVNSLRPDYALAPGKLKHETLVDGKAVKPAYGMPWDHISKSETWTRIEDKKTKSSVPLGWFRINR